MSQIIKNNTPFTAIILFIYTLLVHLQGLFHPELPVASDNAFVFSTVLNGLNGIFFNSPYAYAILTVIMIFGQAIYLNAVTANRKLFTKPTYVVAFMYITLSAIWRPFFTFSEVLLANWFLIMALDMLLTLNQTSRPQINIFNAGLAIGIAGILHFPTLIFFVLLYVAMSLLRNFSLGEWLIGILGVFTPVYFMVGLCYLFDGLHLLQQWPILGFALPRRIDNPMYIIGLLFGIILLFSMGTYSLQLYIKKIGLFARRSWTVVAAYFIFSVIVAILTNFSIKSAWLISIPALSIIIAPVFYNEKTKGFSNFAFYFSLLYMIFCQWAYNK